MKYRLDILLKEKGFFESRSKAYCAIVEKRVKVNGIVIAKPSFRTDEEADISIVKGANYVSRAYRKLSAAMDEFGTNADGVIAVDIGASTGGFTHCLLDRGAKKVYAVDVGKGQLHPSLKINPRVINMESTNARILTKNNFPDEITLAVMDVSFISQSKIYPSVSNILPMGGILITLIKPQFEVGRKNVGKNGIVKDTKGKKIMFVKSFLEQSALKNGLSLKAFTSSPITGGDGNKEYLALFVKEKNEFFST